MGAVLIEVGSPFGEQVAGVAKRLEGSFI